MNLTAKQYEIVKMIWKYRKLHGIAPTLAELADKLDVSKITVHEHITLLERKKALTKEKYQSRSLRLSKKMEKDLEVVEQEREKEKDKVRKGGKVKVDPLTLPLLGRIAAGTAIEALENVDEIVDLRDLVRLDRAGFVLKVKGDSMVDAGIQEGDFVVVEASNQAKNNDIVVAIVRDAPDWETTLKRYFKRGKKHVLEPANSKLRAKTYEDREIEIKGRVVSVIRKY